MHTRLHLALVGAPLAALALLAGVALVRGVLGLGSLGSDDTSLGIAYALLGAFALATLVELVAVPWAIAVLVRDPSARSTGAVLAVTFGAVFGLVVAAIVAGTAFYANGA